MDTRLLHQMAIAYVRNWWPLSLRKHIGCSLGSATFAWSGITSVELVRLSRALALVEGLVSYAVRVFVVCQPKWHTEQVREQPPPGA